MDAEIKNMTVEKRELELNDLERKIKIREDNVKKLEDVKKQYDSDYEQKCEMLQLP